MQCGRSPSGSRESSLFSIVASQLQMPMHVNAVCLPCSILAYCIARPAVRAPRPSVWPPVMTHAPVFLTASASPRRRM
eukprot:2405241-Prymnesium_polylepis.1